MAVRTSAGSGLWSSAGTWDTGVPVNGDSVVIAEGHAVQIDSAVDHAGGGITLVGITINGSSSTPGRLYWKDDAVNGAGNIASSGLVQGTNATNYGQLVATADGTLADTNPLAYTYKAIIRLSGTAELECQYLDVRMRSDEPTLTSVRCYGTKYDFNGATAVNTTTDVIDLGTTPPSAGTMVMVFSAAGTLPTPLEAETMYYIRSVSGNTCKLATQNSDAQIIDLTAVGSGTCTIYTGFASGSSTVNVLDDVTADKWTAGDSVVLANVGPQNYDQQHNITVSTINAGTLVLSASVDSNQNPGARVYLSTRNCSVLHSATSSSQRIINNGTNCVFGEVRASSGTGTTFYCYGINSGSGHTVTTISGCYSGTYSGSGHTVTTIAGGNNGVNSGSGHTAITISGCNNGVYSGSGHTITTISGCYSGTYSGSGHTVTTIAGCSNGINYGSEHAITAISGCTYGINYGSGNTVGNLSSNSYDIKQAGTVYGSGGVINDITNYSLNVDGEIGIVYSEHHGAVYGAQKIFQCFGNATKVAAGSGTPTPDQRASGNDTLIELSNLQTNLSGAGGSGYADNKIIAWEPGKYRIWATASVSKTYRIYVQSTFAISSAADLFLRATYHDSGSDTGFASVSSTQTVTARSGITDWSQYLEVTVNPARTGWVTFDIELRAYSAGGAVYIDPLVVIS